MVRWNALWWLACAAAPGDALAQEARAPAAGAARTIATDNGEQRLQPGATRRRGKERRGLEFQKE
ncbi:hypothetical protein NX905_29525, partial [Burkholderia thailandensis]|nr:hypothetical protein [Burkholderia thailandensis]